MIETGEYISRDAIYAEIRRGFDNYWSAFGGVVEGYSSVEDVLSEIKDFPAADVSLVRRGEWEKKEGRDTIKCSSCGFQMFPLDAYQKGEWPNMCVTFCDEQKYIPRFCPECGAQMNEEVL